MGGAARGEEGEESNCAGESRTPYLAYWIGSARGVPARKMSKRGRGGKARGKSVGRGGGKGRHQDMDNVVCAICNQFDPVIPGSYNRHGDTTEWIGCDCNR